MRNSIANNLKEWDQRYDWTQDGDEWKGMADYCGQPYAAWKAALIERFITPYVGANKTVLEIAPGHGRWSAELVDRCEKLILVDLSPACIEFCRKRFAEKENLEFMVNDGRSLSELASASVDFVWSFDSFVHIDPESIGHYLREFNRVLKPGGHAVIHHAGRSDYFLRCESLTPRGVYRLLSLRKVSGGDGWRSNVSGPLVMRMAAESGLDVVSQVRQWGDAGQYNVMRYRDWITTMRRR